MSASSKEDSSSDGSGHRPKSVKAWDGNAKEEDVEEEEQVEEKIEPKKEITKDDLKVIDELFKDLDQGDGTVTRDGATAIFNGLQLGKPREELAVLDELNEKFKERIPKKEVIAGAQKVVTEPMVGFFELFRFSTAYERLLMLGGCLMAAAHGALQPLMVVVWGNVINNFSNPNAYDLTDVVAENALMFVYLAIAAGVTGFFMVQLFIVAAERQANRIRTLYLRSLMSQEMAWFDEQEAGGISARMSGDILIIREGLGDKVGGLVQFLAMFVAGFAVGFVYSVKITLVILAAFPLLAGSGVVVGTVLAGMSTKGQTAYAKAGGVALEVISSFKTVSAFGNEEREVERYATHLRSAAKNGIEKGHMAGIGLGMTMLIMFGCYGLAFWYGSELILDGELEAGDVVTCFFAVLIGSFALGQGSPNIQAINSGRGAAYEIYKLIDRVPMIDSLSDKGKRPDKIRPHVAFHDVHFHYLDPRRGEVPVLQGLNLELSAGMTMALVGESGCGKSTSVALLQRFYDPTAGSITLDGVDIKDLSVRWLREQLGVVSQEPALFAASIADNIALGVNREVTQKEIESAARMANAHNFIRKLDAGYKTLVGERGAQLSGGQKQRIAIARALIRDPKILLLDEATSALDRTSEKVVQDALDEASKTRTTIVIAHRLATVRNADVICVLDKGVVVEKGSHDDLMALDGRYAHLVKIQEVHGGAEADQSESGAIAKDADDSIMNQGVATAAADKKAAATAKDEEEDEDEEVAEKHPFRRVMRLNLREWPYIFLGTLGAIIGGLIFPFYAIIFSEMISDMLLLTGDELKDSARFWALMFVVIGVASFVGNYLQTAMFATSGERLTLRIRKMLFKAILSQEMAWFDDAANSSGVLATKLASDATAIQGVSAVRLGVVAQALASLGGGLGIALWACWRLALVVLATVPVMVIAGILQLQALMGFNNDAKTAFEESGHVAAEAIFNIKTVVGLGRENFFMDRYHRSLAGPHSAGVKNSVVAGLGFGFGEAVPFLVFALAFWYGSIVVKDGDCTFSDMMTALMAVLFGAMMAGQANSIAPDAGKAKIAAQSIFKVVDREPAISVMSEGGSKPRTCGGEVAFQGVGFSYPSRPGQKILKGLSLTVSPGESVALVGDSGCGKSTLLQLLLRFYSPSEGKVSLDGTPVEELNLQWLRSNIGVVSQEPVLFDTTIKENIMYGNPDASMDDVVAAAKKANCHDFISKFNQKYETSVGEKGGRLSGGQKQRVAIARAILRDPKILLLDEATSALDSESEKVVQSALDAAAEGRTTITIAHRLSTIQNVDRIVFIKDGVVTESGSHEELLLKRGDYYNLVHKK